MLTEPACTHCMEEGGGGGGEVSESLIVVLALSYIYILFYR